MKVEHLTFTRFVAAILVVFFHIGASSMNPATVAGSLLSVGSSALSYFFVLSGFILIVSNARGGQLPVRLRRGEFWRNRVARIYPLYLFALVLTILFGALTGSDRLNEMTAGSVAASAALVQAWWPPFAMQLNFPGWSLSAETFFYILFPLLYLPAVRRSTGQLVAAVGLFWAVSLAVHVLMIDHHVLHDLTLYFPLLHLSTFLVGVATGIVFVRHRSWLIRKHRWVSAVFITGLVISFWIVLGHLPIVSYHHNGLFAPLFALFIVWTATQTNGFTRWLSRPLPVRLGEISYGIYLLQVPVGIVAFYVNYQILHWPVWVYVPLYTGLLLGASEVCYRWIEQPARRLIRQWTTPLLSATPADEQFSRQT